MSWRSVEIERADGVAVLRIDRGGSRNALSQELIGELGQAVSQLAEDPEVRAVVFTGTSEAFSAGIDLKDPKKWQDEELPLFMRREIAFRGARLCAAVEAMPQITIAAIEGFAVGAGVAITIACDWRVLARDAYLWLPEIKLGLNLSWGAVPRLTTLVGPAKAKRALLLCEKLSADTALEWGLADRVSDPGEALAVAKDLASAIADLPPTPVRISKESVNAVATALHRTAVYADGDQGLVCRDSAEAREARAKFAR